MTHYPQTPEQVSAFKADLIAWAAPVWGKDPYGARGYTHLGDMREVKYNEHWMYPQYADKRLLLLKRNTP